jgi:hypothetical protein
MVLEVSDEYFVLISQPVPHTVHILFNLNNNAILITNVVVSVIVKQQQCFFLVVGKYQHLY